MKILKWIGIGLGVIFLAIQFVRPERTNPPVDAARTVQAVTGMPAEVAAIIDRACRDCHTYETHWPWYSHVAPVSWLVARDVEVGRGDFNLSDWAAYELYEQESLLDELCEEVEDGHMPLPKYVRLHGEARLSEADVRTLCDWAQAERARVASLPDPGAAPEAEAVETATEPAPEAADS